MRHIVIFAICLCLFASCKKEPLQADPYLEKVKTALQDSISATDYSALEFSKSVLSSVDSVNLHLLRVPFKHLPATHFVLLQTTAEGSILQGRIVWIEGEVREKKGFKKFQGNIRLLSLERNPMVESAIQDGFITAFHNNRQSRTSSLQPDHVLPEVIITYVRPSNGGGFSWSSWMSLQSLFNGTGADSYYNYFSGDAGGSWSGGGSTGYPYPTGGGGGPTGGGGPANEPPILIDFENQDELLELDLQKIINCFNAVPNSGAHCTIEILTDIPVDANPDAVYDLGEKAPGHVFLKLSKHNGAQQVDQYIGFYPKSGYKSVTYAPTPSKLVTNQFHEYNASLSMDLTPERLATAISAIQLYSGHNYDVDQYNCTNFALDVFNSVRGIGLSIPLYGLPGSPMTHSTATPGGLYHKLKEMSNNNDPEKPNIAVGLFKGWAGSNAGLCN